MQKLLKYIIIILLIIIIGFISFKFFNKTEDTDTDVETNAPKEVFKNPETIVYQINGKEKFRLSKEDDKYNQILDKLNSSLIEDFTSIQVAREKFATITYINNIEEQIYSSNAVLRLIYNEIKEIDIIFEEDSVLDIIYVDNGKYECFNAFEEASQKELKDYLDNI